MTHSGMAVIFCFQILGKPRLRDDFRPEVEAGLGNLLRLYHKKAGKWREKKHRQEETAALDGSVLSVHGPSKLSLSTLVCYI